ncbi:MAG: hypothetical protein WD468_11535 [Pirellulales bacterium]
MPGQAPPPPPVIAMPTTAPMAPPPIAPLPTGNMQAPPVYSNAPAVPLAPAPAAVGPPPVVTVPSSPMAFTAPTAPPVPIVAQSVAVPPVGAIPIGQDHLRITPDRFLAPVGSEVVLKAGICSKEGYLQRDRRVEWLLDSCGTGKFVDVAERDQVDIFRWVWNTPHKHDNNFVVGATSGQAVVLDRGTPDPSDDIQVADGEAWVSVTSASEGTSRITAYSPTVGNWQFRQASATIFWVDAAWIFPPSAVVEPGRPHVLTTTVVRRTDNAPLAGWIVRYDVGGGASLGYEGGNFVEAITDANGRASMEVSPSGAGGGSTTVSITINRPPQGAPDSTPRLEIGRGCAVITWGSAATPGPAAMPTPNFGAPAVTGVMPAPSLPATPAVPNYPFAPSGASPTPATSVPALEPTPRTTPQNTAPLGDGYRPPPSEPPAGRPQLDVTLRRIGTEGITVGDYVSFEVTVTNKGDGTARQIEVRDLFDRGLSHPSAKPGENSVEYLGMRDLAPGESAALPSPLTFKVLEAGQQCHEVSVSAQDVAPIKRSACISTQQSTIEVSITGERLHVVGEKAAFNIIVRNTGDVVATNLEVVSTCDPGLTPIATEEGHEPLGSGGILYRIDRLEVGERKAFRLVAQCTAAGNNVCNHVTVKSGGREIRGADACLEIRPQLPGGAGLNNAPAGSAPNLQVTIASTPNPARVGEAAQILVTVTNTGQQVERQVALAVLLPDELTPVEAQIQPAGTFVRTGQELRFQAAIELPPNHRLTYTIPVNPTHSGNVAIRAQLAAEGLAAPLRAESPISILSPSL